MFAVGGGDDDDDDDDDGDAGDIVGDVLGEDDDDDDGIGGGLLRGAEDFFGSFFESDSNKKKKPSSAITINRKSDKVKKNQKNAKIPAKTTTEEPTETTEDHSADAPATKVEQQGLLDQFVEQYDQDEEEAESQEEAEECNSHFAIDIHLLTALFHSSNFVHIDQHYCFYTSSIGRSEGR